MSRYGPASTGTAISNVVEDTTPTLGGALDAGGFDINNGGVVFLTEQAAAEADVAGKGQFWVLTATPNLPKFTDDAGTDFALKTSGRETHPIPASEWCPTITNGCGRSYTELATNDLISDTLDFDTTTQQFATAIWCPPKKYNGGTITFRVKHRMPNSATTETVDYALSGAFIRNNDAADATLGTAVVVTDTWLADENEHVSPESTAVTLAGTYAEGCKVALKLQRNVAGDNAAGDTLVEAVEIFWTSNAGTDT
jgi:hypothetical protein